MCFAGILILGRVRVGIRPLIQISQRMVHLAMLGLVCPHIQQQVLHSVMALGHFPVRDRNFGCLHLGPLGEGSAFNLVDGPGVSDDSFFFEVRDEAVADAGGDKVGEEEAVEEDALGSEDHETHEEAGFGEFQEGEEMHAFVLCFFQKGFDPKAMTSAAVLTN